MIEFAINAEQAQRHITEDGALIIDIRDKTSYQAGHIPGARSVTTEEEVEEFMKAASKDQIIICCCYHGNSSRAVTNFLRAEGYNATSLNGGFAGWTH